MESPSGFGQVGIRIQDCTLPARELHLGWALESAISAGSVGDGTTGDLTGITTMSFITTTLTSPTAGSSLITTPSIARMETITAADFRVDTDFRAAALAEIRGAMVQPSNMDLQPHSMDSQLRNTDLRRRMFSPAVIPARSAALIMEEFREASRLGGSPASAAAFMEVAVSTAVAAEAFTAAAEVTAAEATGNSVRSHKRD
jgi:hypothetical protein